VGKRRRRTHGRRTRHYQHFDSVKEFQGISRIGATLLSGAPVTMCDLHSLAMHHMPGNGSSSELKTWSAPAFCSSSVENFPLATPTDTAPAARVASMSCGVSPTT
jgi:hypothetical protein